VASWPPIGDDGLVITERGRVIAVTVTVDRWNALQDRLDDLQAHIVRLKPERAGRPPWQDLLEDLQRE